MTYSLRHIHQGLTLLSPIGANYLLNIGPDPFGRLPVSAVNAVLAAR